jgi:rhodanese-related sulfurtransferase
MSQYIALGLLAVVLVVFWYLKRPNIGRNEAHQMVSNGARLVDVRSPGEFASRHIDGARNIPVSEIGNRTAELQPLDGPIIVYCASGARSAMAARTLRSSGFTSVYNLGSISNW